LTYSLMARSRGWLASIIVAILVFIAISAAILETHYGDRDGLSFSPVARCWQRSGLFHDFPKTWAAKSSLLAVS
jgi:hypothetical protein